MRNGANMIRRSGQISEEFSKSLDKVAFPMPANLKPADIQAAQKRVPVPDVDWWSMKCPDCGQEWSVGREKGKPAPEPHCSVPECKGKRVEIKKEN